jgi:hypothetical protein
VIVRIRTVFAGVPGTPWYSNLYFADDGGVSVAQVAHDAVQAFWVGRVGLQRAPITGTVLGEVPRIQESTGDIVSVSTVTPTTFAATGATDQLPYMTQALVRLFTAAFIGGRRVRGRLFFPGALEAQNIGGLVESGMRTNLDSGIDVMIASAPLCVWARPFAGDPAATPPKPARLGSYHLVTDGETAAQWSVLRSRRD